MLYCKQMVIKEFQKMYGPNHNMTDKHGAYNGYI